MRVDEIGAYVHYKNKSDLKINNLRRFLSFRQNEKIHIRADNPVHFFNKFCEEYPGSRIGGPTPEGKAIWIEEDKPIIELPDCPHLFETEEGFRCGDESYTFGPTRCYLEDNFVEPYENMCVPYKEYNRVYAYFNGKVSKSLNRYEILLNKDRQEYREDIIQGHIFLRRGINAVHLSLWPFERKKEVNSFSYIV
jgi:hypothetical protein